jgi:hypothetical protein
MLLLYDIKKMAAAQNLYLPFALTAITEELLELGSALFRWIICIATCRALNIVYLSTVSNMTAIKLSFPEVLKPSAICSTSRDNYICLVSSDGELWTKNKIFRYDL